MTSNELERFEGAANTIRRATETFRETVGKGLAGIDKAQEAAVYLIQHTSNTFVSDFNQVYEPKVSSWLEDLRNTALTYKTAADRMHAAAELMEKASQEKR